MTDAGDLSEKQHAILRRRAVEASWAVLWAIGSAELMFGSIAIGSALGPSPLRPIEVLLGSTGFFISGAIASFWLARKRQEKDARLIARVREGRREHRVVVFEDHVTIGGEVVLRDAISSSALDERGLVLRYKDPRFEGVVLRELTGDRRVLETIVTAFLPGSERSGSERSGAERSGSERP